jgi:hypothetical protein
MNKKQKTWDSKIQFKAKYFISKLFLIQLPAILKTEKLFDRNVCYSLQYLMTRKFFSL